MKNLIFILGISVVFLSCTASKDNNKEESVEGLKASIKEMDDSLNVLVEKVMTTSDFKINRAVYYEAINRNKDFYFHFPKDPYAEVALEKIASMFLQLNQEDRAVKWRDTLLTKYPNTKDKIGLLELQMSYYDYNEHNPEKYKYYAHQYLAIKDLPKEKRESCEFRLKHIDLTFDQLIELKAKDSEDSTATGHRQ